MMSSVCAKSTSGLRSTSAFSGTAARSSARTSLSDPLPARPIGVRMASTMTASGISSPCLTDQSIVAADRRDPRRQLGVAQHDPHVDLEARARRLAVEEVEQERGRVLAGGTLAL